MESTGVIPYQPHDVPAEEISRLGPLPSLFFTNAQTAKVSLEFFLSNLGNDNTLNAYLVAARSFSLWCAQHGITDLAHVRPIDVSSYIQQTTKNKSIPTAKQHLAAMRHLFDRMVVGQVIPHNPAHAVRGPKHVVTKGKTIVLTAGQTRALLDSIDTTTLVGKRDRALIALMTYTFARVTAAISMSVEDYYILDRRGKVRLHEKGGKFNEVPCHHNLDKYLEEYIAAAGLASEPKSPLFRRAHGGENKLVAGGMSRNASYKMIRRRTKAAGINVRIGNHCFRGTGITTYRKNGGKLDVAQRMAGHSSPRTTLLYDRSEDDISLDEVERITL